MRFERLRLQGFKSFVDPTELLIGPGLTGIVGPNGCGKSNLLEALRWVMGEGSARSLRGTGMDDVIFAGTATRPQRGAAEVGLHGWRADGEEMEVVRRIERGAGSAYRIDGRDARARDVALLFADASTGAHSPALVSQGRISAIIAARPAERRAMLEEAAGIVGLHVRRRDAEARLRATEANLDQVGEAVVQMEARAQVLVRQARAAERYRAIGQRIRIAEARLLHSRWRDASAVEAAARAEAQSAEHEVQRLGTAHAAATIRLREAVAALTAARSAAEAARGEATALSHQAAAVAARRGEAERRLSELGRARSALDHDRTREERLAADAVDAMSRLAMEAADLKAQLAATEERRAEAARSQDEADRAAAAADAALAAAQAAKAAQDADVRIAEGILLTARRRADAARIELDRVESASASLVNPDLLGDALAVSQAQESSAAAAVEMAQREIVAIEEEHARLVAARAQADALLSSTLAEVKAMRTEAAALETARRSALTQDRLANEIDAPAGLELAVAAALGADVDFPVAAWSGTPPTALETDGEDTLDAVVTAPPALRPRLRSIRLVSEDDGAPLAIGRSVVTPAGRVRRWDGLVTEGTNADTAAVLLRENRRRELEQSLPARERQALVARTEAEAVAAALTDAGRRAASTRAAMLEAEDRGRAARREADRLAGLIERAVAQAADMEARRRRAQAERDSAGTDVAAAEQALAALATQGDSHAALAPLAAVAHRTRSEAARLRAEDGASRQALAAIEHRQAAVKRDLHGWTDRSAEAARRLNEISTRGAAIGEETAALSDVPARLDAEASLIAERHRQAAEMASEAAERLHVAEADRARLDGEAAAISEALASAREARAGASAREEGAIARRVETGRISGERFSCPAAALPAVAGFDPADVGTPAAESDGHDRLLAERERMGPVNLVAEAELAELREAVSARSAERDDLVAAIAALRASIGALNREGRQRLLAAFETVDGHFRRLFSTLFQGGEAHLALIDADDPLEAGLEIMAQPPGKRLQSLSLLSGGEQALTAVALIFALFLTAPAPVCVLDEVDAPLDDANIERFCDLLDLMALDTETRYLVVTHNAVTMSRMHRLFGVTMVERGVSRLVSVDLGGAEALMAAE
ncbi:chromosome segregation SMC family protein [Sphingomonas jejuensis]|nr:AAA family ATPase [Sphingomonas jejuensis]